jgi:predicted permease
MPLENWLYTIPLRLRAILRRRADQELDEELRFHLEQQIRQNVARGLDAGEARRQALIALGGFDQSKEQCRDVRPLHLAADLANDLAYAARILRQSPAFAITAILTISLGIGAATAIFSVTDAVLLRPLPYPNSSRLILSNDRLSNACFYDLRRGTRAAFDDLAAVMVFRAVVPRGDGGADRISKGFVTTNFLRMLGAHIAFGRDFSEADGQPQGQPPPLFPWTQGSLAILSYDYFTRRYGADPAVIGRYMPGPAGIPGPRIIGVLQPGFKLYLPDSGIGPQPSPDVWIPNDRGYDAANRGGLTLLLVGVLQPGITLLRAQSQLDRVAATWPANDRPDVGISAWHSALVAEFRPALLALMGAVIFLLLIACSNIANLLLVRVSLRERELAVRAAMGARAGRLTRQLLAESLLLCGLGTSLGIAFAWAAIRQLLALAPANLPRLETTSIDWRVLAFAALAGLLEAATLGILPGWRAARPDIMQMLRNAGRSANLNRGSFLRSGVVIAEVALAFVLLVGSGLMFRSFLALLHVDSGFDPHGLLTFFAIGDAQGFTEPARRTVFLRDLEDRLRAIPGVQGVGAALSLPLTPGGPAHGIQWSTAGIPALPSRLVDLPTVLPGYFETLRARFLEGRPFTAADNAARRNVAIIDQSLAAKAFPNRSALGQRICVYVPDSTCLEIIGVIEHQRIHSLADVGFDQIYMLDGFWGIGISRHWALRTSGDPASYAPAVRAAIAAFAPGRLAVTEMRTMDAIVDQAQLSTRFHLLLIGIFATIGALLAAVGLYGVLSSAVRQRTAEIGVRIALGAAPATIFKLIIGQGLALSAAGLILGFAAAAVLTRGMRSMLVGIAPTDPAAFAGMTLFFLLVASAACWLPARRAAHLDPTAALREE